MYPLSSTDFGKASYFESGDRCTRNKSRPTRSAIPKTQVKLSSSLEFADTENIYRDHNGHDPVFVGNASAEIDQAWDDLILREFLAGSLLTVYTDYFKAAEIYVSDLEAKPVGGELHRSLESGNYQIESVPPPMPSQETEIDTYCWQIGGLPHFTLSGAFKSVPP